MLGEADGSARSKQVIARYYSRQSSRAGCNRKAASPEVRMDADIILYHLSDSPHSHPSILFAIGQCSDMEG